MRLLAYEDISAEIGATIAHFLATNDTPTTSIMTLWEALKTVIRDQVIAIAARLNIIRCEKRQQLEVDIRALEATNSRTGSLALNGQLTAHMKQLRALDGDKAEYALLRTKQKVYAGGVKAARLLVHCLRVQATGRRVAEVRVPDSTMSGRANSPTVSEVLLRLIFCGRARQP
ncbi:hypothetical protein NDU88_005189 [Pleurodeles waltl]|uniref:Uncharacterized protein n=1 Tax=Pleurodeles waltl TaxID=8319 RepID=A0AAV7MYI9_PLEWA|nr:hypothetical protein NDU88_005189 [Pleurodeles waltl]